MNHYQEAGLQAGLQAGYVPVRHSGLHRPLFLIQDRHSVEAVFGVIAERNHVDLPVYGLSARAVSQSVPPTVEGLATRVLQAIRAIQPEGPYRLAGFGQCALVAYEIATQLAGQDQQVEFLGLVGAAVHCDLGRYAPQPSQSLPVHLFVQEACTPVLLRKVDGGATAPPPAQPGAPDDSLTPDAPLLPWRGLLPADQVRTVTVPGDADGAPSRALARALCDAAVAARVPEPAEAAYRPLLTIQTGNRGAVPLFCIPGAGDSVTGFTGLASALGAAWPLHGLQPRGIEGQLIPHSTVEAAADCYVRAIVEAQPHGPVHLAGHSFGGWIAFEAALRLRAMGRGVASLTIIDSEAPGAEGDPASVLGREYDALDVSAMFVESLELAAERDLGIGREALAAVHGAARLAAVHAGAVRAGLMPARSQPGVLHGCLRTFGAALRTVYHPSAHYPGPVRLVLIPDTRLEPLANAVQFDRMEQGWRRVAPQLSCWQGPGNHMTILKAPHAASLARWWLAGLEDAARHAVPAVPQRALYA